MSSPVVSVTGAWPALPPDTRPAQAERRQQLAGRRERGLAVGLASLFSPLLLLVVWEALVRVHALDRRFFPAPSSIAGTFGALVASGALLVDVEATVARLCVGLLLGAVPGLLIGVTMGLSGWLRAFLKPIVAALFPIPKIAILPLIMLIFGLGEWSKYVSVAFGVVFVVLINSMAGVMNIDRIYLDVAKNYGAGRWQLFYTVALPGALPAMLTGIQLSAGIGLIVVIATEFVGARTGIGHLIWQSWQMFAIEEMYCGLVVTALLGFLLQLLLDAMQRVLLPWQPQRR